MNWKKIAKTVVIIMLFSMSLNIVINLILKSTVSLESLSNSVNIQKSFTYFSIFLTYKLFCLINLTFGIYFLIYYKSFKPIQMLIVYIFCLSD